jgi:cobalt-zinc-cadmium resistance protein CzcA
VIAQVEGVASVSRRTGRSEETEDPMPHVLSDVLVQLRPPGDRPDTDAIADDVGQR